MIHKSSANGGNGFVFASSDMFRSQQSRSCVDYAAILDVHQKRMEFKKSAPMIGRETSAIQKRQVKFRLNPSVKFNTLSPYSLIALMNTVDDFFLIRSRMFLIGVCVDQRHSRVSN